MSRNRECGDIKLPKLLRCPFCGGRAKLQFGYHMMVDAKVACIKCHSEGPLFGADASSGEFRPRAIAAWNKRAAVELNRPWKPIESAPKDKRLIVHGNEGGVDVAEYEYGKWSVGYDDHGNDITLNAVTHWMPLPEPPEGE